MSVHKLFVYLCVNNASDAIAFYKKAFGAREKFRLADASGHIGHAEIEIDGITLMLSDEFAEYGITAPSTLGGTAVTIHLHVDNADEVIKRAADAGARVENEPSDQFYGERSGSLKDPFGHRWNIGHSIEDVSPEEMQKRYRKMTGG